jgi:hypothetical protein
VKVQSARSKAEEKPHENRIVACGIVLARINSREKEKHDYSLITDLGHRNRGVGRPFGCASVRGKRG